MAVTLATINNLINDRRRDTTSNTIDMTTDGFRAVNTALDVWNQEHDWPWQIEKTTVNYTPGVDVYDLPDKFKAMVDMRPQKQTSTELKYVSNNSFDRKDIYSSRFAVRIVDGKQRLRCRYTGGTSILIHDLGSISDNGTAVAAGDASNLSKELYETFEGTSSLKFDYSGTSGTITITGMRALDLTRYKDRSIAYFNMLFPTVTNLTSVSLKLGSDASNYYSTTVTTDYLGNDIEADVWTKLGFDWNNSTETGTVDIENIDYVQITLAYGGATTDTAFRIENLFISEKIPMTLEYYTTNMVYDVSGTANLAQFNDSSATTDYPLWSGDWDYANEAFINSILDYVFFMTGETTEYTQVINNITRYLNPLKARLPSRRRYPEMTITTDTNY